jgi:hypothetical protein
MYRQLYRRCSESLQPIVMIGRAVRAHVLETVHIYGGTRDGIRAQARARVVWTYVFKVRPVDNVDFFIICNYYAYLPLFSTTVT